MKIAVLGTGMVGQAIATKLVELGYDVAMGSRTDSNEAGQKWANHNSATSGTFDQVSNGAGIIFNATHGAASLEVLRSISKENLDGKIIVDIANELEIKDGRPMSMVNSENVLGVKIQNEFPSAKVVKTLNTLNASLMVNPGALSEPTNVFLSGNDMEAKNEVRALLKEFGWQEDFIIDLGGIETAIGPEMYLMLWLSLFLRDGNNMDANFNLKITK